MAWKWWIFILFIICLALLVIGVVLFAYLPVSPQRRASKAPIPAKSSLPKVGGCNCGKRRST